MDVTSLPEWQILEARAAVVRGRRVADLFQIDPQRAQKYSLSLPGMLLDFSKNLIDEPDLAALLALADACDLADWRDKLFSGAPINATEGRPVLHTALREQAPGSAGDAVSTRVSAELAQVRSFVSRLRSGGVSGYSCKKFTRLVCLGIGGSNLGPQMVVEALAQPGPVTVDFVSNLDGVELASALAQADPETTLFVVSSKTFTTAETLTNAESVLRWYAGRASREQVLSKHFVGITANTEKAKAFGIAPEHIFSFGDWVGGRFSLWSSIGLPIAAALGFEAFERLLAGAAVMDRHFREAPLARNAPVLMGLISLWNCSFLGYPAHAILPYNQKLHLLPAYLQQADMESNGKSVTRDGSAAHYRTGPLIWGQLGINGQHAFYQYLHQGTEVVPADFIGTVEADHELPGHHQRLLCNMLAQARALMTGVSVEEVRRDLHARGLGREQVDALAPFKVHTGNRPSTTILLDRLEPESLGALIALYEHKIFVQGVILQIYSFDQWGVELGKGLAAELEQRFAGADFDGLDASTKQLAEYLRANGGNEFSDKTPEGVMGA
ncbi:glucose-6-phosphate isomerase [Biformimicrobium ophioploci]|uniref:Glucose-6-phosphate isomerase n=1 Tax=Biformimicrobium ophioploci TaxID=3036711 RepID=A0ABQ6LWP7_9GAMM|nr:glucose-6-phosphate isomerase [Microbulbifer sp. NKW57]GMG86522.1 glucose-6-phosphate isomerase [Microbulbifer sp. NKW57]